MRERALVARRRSVAARILSSYALLSAAFALVAGWSVLLQRTSATEAELLRSGYLPLALALRDAVADQDAWNAQLNHITTAQNPADKRVWFDAASGGRPRTFARLRAAIHRAFIASGDAAVRRLGQELMHDSADAEELTRNDSADLSQLFDALSGAEHDKAEGERAELVTRGNRVKVKLSLLEARVQQNVDGLLDAARARERLAIRLLIALALSTLLVGVAMALYARRVLRPLGAVTARAQAVARGDLRPEPVPGVNDEIGELAETFERMVAAIASANERLLATERLAAIGKMAAHVTHEIRNPLSSMALNVELLEDELSSDAQREARALLRAIKNEVERLTELSGQYLSVARQQPLRLLDEDVGEVAREATDFVKGELARHGVELKLDVEPDLPRAQVDEAQLKQALFNLLRNAREAMPGGGRISVRVRRVADDALEIAVDDQGEGIDEATRERLFEPFFTTKGHGTGLGLAITRQIVEAHAGSIRCEPLTPRGTSFKLCVPLRPPG